MVKKELVNTAVRETGIAKSLLFRRAYLVSSYILGGNKDLIYSGV